MFIYLWYKVFLYANDSFVENLHPFMADDGSGNQIFLMTDIHKKKNHMLCTYGSFCYECLLHKSGEKNISSFLRTVTNYTALAVPKVVL